MSDEKKIYVDEDWKNRVETEREMVGKPVQEKPHVHPDFSQWPDPSLSLLVTTLATQAMVGLGLVEHPLTGKSEIDLAQSRHFIDTIAMLNEKTKGNQTDEEKAVLENVLHEIQMVYVQVEASQGAR